MPVTPSANSCRLVRPTMRAPWRGPPRGMPRRVPPVVPAWPPPGSRRSWALPHVDQVLDGEPHPRARGVVPGDECGDPTLLSSSSRAWSSTCQGRGARGNAVTTHRFRRPLLVEEGAADGRPPFLPRCPRRQPDPDFSGRSSARPCVVIDDAVAGRVPLHEGLLGAPQEHPKPQRRRHANNLGAGRPGTPPFPRPTRVRRPRDPRRPERRSRSWRRRGRDRPAAVCLPRNSVPASTALSRGRCSPSGWPAPRPRPYLAGTIRASPTPKRIPSSLPHLEPDPDPFRGHVVVEVTVAPRGKLEERWVGRGRVVRDLEARRILRHLDVAQDPLGGRTDGAEVPGTPLATTSTQSMSKPLSDMVEDVTLWPGPTRPPGRSP